jgi:hypothetical protein
MKSASRWFHYTDVYITIYLYYMKGGHVNKELGNFAIRAIT